MLLKAQSRQENLEHLRFTITLKKLNLDTSDSKQLNEYNNLLKEYNDILNPSRIIERDKFSNTLKDDLATLDLSKMNLNKLKPIKDKVISENSRKNTLEGNFNLVANKGR